MAREGDASGRDGAGSKSPIGQESWNIPPKAPVWEPWPVPAAVPGPTEMAQQEPRSDAALAQGACIPVIYGRCFVAPDIFYGHVYNAGTGNTGWFGLGFSHGPIEAYESWWINKSWLINAAGMASVFGVKCERTGTFTQNKIGYGGEPSGTYGANVGNSHGSLPGLAYIYMETVENSATIPSAIIQGRKLYDPRLGSWTTGEDPPSAYCAYNYAGGEQGKNPALQMADLLTNSHYGCGIACTSVDWTSVSDAASYCDDIVDSAKRFQCSIVLDHRDDANAWFKTIGAHFGGAWQQREGLWYLYVHKVTSTVDSYITADHFVSSPKLSRQTGAGLADLPNRVTVEWTDADHEWVVQSVSVCSAGVEAGEAVREGSPYQLLGCQSEKQAYRSAWYLLNMMSADLTLSGTLMPSQLHLRVGSLINVTEASVGLSSNSFIVTQIGRNDDDTVTFQATEYSAAIWSPAAYTPTALTGTPGQDVFNAHDPIGVGLKQLTNGSWGIYWTPPVIKTTALYGASYWTVVGAKTTTTPDLAAINDGSTAAVAVVFETGAYPTRSVTLDLGAGAVAFRGVWRTQTAKDHVFSWYYEYSDNGSVWTGITPYASGSRFQTTGGLWVEECAWADVGSHRYWRFRVAASVGSGQIDIREVQFWSSSGIYQFVNGYEVHLGPTAAGRLMATIPAIAAPTVTTPLDVEALWVTNDTPYSEGGVSNPYYGRLIQELYAVVVTVSSLNQRSAGMGVSSIREPSTVTGSTSLAGKFRSPLKSCTMLPSVSAAGEARLEVVGGIIKVSENNGPWGNLRVDAPPIGSMLLYGAAAAPSGWLLCNGAAVSRATYAALFAIIGITYGAGDGSTTFNVPNLQQRFPLGKAASGTGSTLGGTGGAIDHTHTVDPGAVASAAYDPPAVNSSGVQNLSGKYLAAGSDYEFLHNHSVDLPSHTHSVDIPSTTSSANNPPYVVVSFIIKY